MTLSSEEKIAIMFVNIIKEIEMWKRDNPENFKIRYFSILLTEIEKCYALFSVFCR